MRKFVLAVSMLLAAMLGGCSYSKQFAAASTPLVDQIAADEAVYTTKETDLAKKAAVQTRLDMLVSAAHAGDRDAAAPVWFGVPGVKDDYVAYLMSDPKLSSGTGLQGRTILLNNVATLDYIMGVGRKQNETK